MDPRAFAMQMLQKNPNIAKNKKVASMINAIKNNDAAQGEEIANNILKSYGMTKEQALELAHQRFGI